jgi:hypothetical protein
MTLWLVVIDEILAANDHRWKTGCYCAAMCGHIALPRCLLSADQHRGRSLGNAVGRAGAYTLGAYYCGWLAADQYCWHACRHNGTARMRIAVGICHGAGVVIAYSCCCRHDLNYELSITNWELFNRISVFLFLKHLSIFICTHHSVFSILHLKSSYLLSYISGVIPYILLLISYSLNLSYLLRTASYTHRPHY